MKIHDQKGIASKPFVCSECKSSRCEKCIDIARATAGLTTLTCTCRRKKHVEMRAVSE